MSIEEIQKAISLSPFYWTNSCGISIMKPISILLLILAICAPNAQSQNLIPNPSFEETTGCPGASVFLKNTNHWHRIENHYGSPDQYYGDCSYNGVVNPMAPGQKPYEGVGYAGQFCFGDKLREYMTVKLCEPMVKDSNYSIEFFIMPAAGYGTAIDSYGVHFSAAEPKGSSDRSLAVLELEEHIGNPKGNLINDTVNWTPIKGVYRAKGGERYATFGNFRADANCANEVMKEICIRSDRSYMLIDGVEVVDASLKEDVLELVNPIEHVTLDTNNLNERELVVRYLFETKKSKVELLFWDHLKQDGDIVNVMLNDSLLLDHYLITKQKNKIELSLEPGEYYLKLIAVNLGEIPPNTCSIRIFDSKKRRTFVLNSDMGKTESIKIIVE